MAILDDTKINACSMLLERYGRSRLSNFEVRMVAEVRLYWIIYKHYMGISDKSATDTGLSLWKQEWIDLFGKPSTVSMYALLKISR